MCSPIDRPVRGSVLAGTWMPTSVGRKARAALARSVGLLARLSRSSLRRSFSGTTTGASEARVDATGDARVDLAQRDLVRDEDRGLEPGAAGLGDVVGRRRRRQARAEHRLTGEVEVAAVLDDRAGDDLPEPLPGQAVAGDEALEGRRSACPGSRPPRRRRTGGRRGSGCRRGRRRGGWWSPVWLLAAWRRDGRRSWTRYPVRKVTGTGGSCYRPGRGSDRARHRTGAARAGTSTASPAAQELVEATLRAIRSARRRRRHGRGRGHARARRRRSSTGTSPTGPASTPRSPSGSTPRSSAA